MTPIQLEKNPAQADWDRCLGLLRGHPLQSSLWGEARRDVDGIEDLRFLAGHLDHPILMARVERRRIPLLGSVAWIPKGPAHDGSPQVSTAYSILMDTLRKEDFIVVIDGAYPDPIPQDILQGTPFAATETAWLNPVEGRDARWAALDSQWRYGVGRAKRLGVIVEQSRRAEDIDEFFALCETISRDKKFELPGSLPLLRRLFEPIGLGASSVMLFAARVDSRLVAGAVIFRVGARAYYFWGAMNREFSRYRPGEAVQWAVIEWACRQGLQCYDLEGMDRLANPGTFDFKVKMGGRMVALPPRYAHVLDVRGRLVMALNRIVHRF
jgi:hypothetical protein